jgi:Mn2+/Fe2+ NRAMP family transporter
VTKRGHAEAIFDGFGPFWGWFSLGDLALVNWLTLITEYIGMTEAMAMFGIPRWITYIGVTLILFAVVISGKYWTFEKVTLFFCLFNLVYIPAAFWGMSVSYSPGWGKAMEGFLPQFPGGLTGDMIFILMANIGTTIAPWMIFFQQSAVVDKGMDVHDIPYGQIETFLGSVSTNVVAVFIILTTGAVLFYHHPPITVEDVKQTAEALMPLMPHGQGDWARKLYAIGLFDAGFLGALCISLSSSWAVGEVFGWAHSLNARVRDAIWFYLIYLGMLATAGAVVLIPEAPLITITMFVQVIAVTVLPAALIFLLLLLNDKATMGDHVNTRVQNIMNWSIVIIVCAGSTLLGIQTMFPSWFGGSQ